MLLGIVLQKLWMFWQSPGNVFSICSFVKLPLLRQRGLWPEDPPSAVSIAPGFGCETGQIIEVLGFSCL